MESRFEELYKNRVLKLTMAQRALNLNQHRRTSRATLLKEVRQIPDILTPIASPTVAEPPEPKKESRFELMKKWQQEKKKRQLEQKKNSKPRFKVCHVTSTTSFNLDTVYKEIKGRPIAPSSVYKFKPPINVKPVKDPKSDSKTVPKSTNDSKLLKNSMIKESRSRSKESIKSNVPKKPLLNLPKTSIDSKNVLKSRTRSGMPSTTHNANLESNPIKSDHVASKGRPQRLTRSQTNVDAKNVVNGSTRSRGILDSVSEESLKSSANVNSKALTSNTLKRSKRNKSQDSRKSITSKVSLEPSSSLSSSLSPEYPIAGDISSTESESPSKLVTPQKKVDASEVCYISPFVTVSRGKENSRREYQKRSRTGGSLGTASTSPQAAAAHFRVLLDSQIARLKMLCSNWHLYKEEQQPPEGAGDMIDVAIGQTELLIRKKFQQFRGLVDSCESGNAEKPVTCLDLHGFWDMVMIQVDNLDKRFENLENLKTNNWEEILPEPTTRPKPKKAAAKKKKKKVAGSSTLRAAIQEARKKKAEQKQPESDVLLPLKSPASGRKSRSRRSLRTAVLINESVRLESPVVKSASKDTTPLRKQGSAANTPKSILKSEKSRRSRRQTKTVLFVESDQENDANASNTSVQFSPPRTRQLRKSLRFD